MEDRPRICACQSTILLHDRPVDDRVAVATGRTALAPASFRHVVEKLGVGPLQILEGEDGEIGVRTRRDPTPAGESKNVGLPCRELVYRLLQGKVLPIAYVPGQ